jgi:hypothetical protein
MPEYQVLNGVGYSIPNEQRRYTPPPPPEPFRAPPVTAGAARVAGTVLEQATAALAHAAKERQKHIEKMAQHRHLYTDDGYQAQIAQFANTDAAKSVDKAVDAVRARQAQAQAKLDKLLNPSSVGDTAHELRNGRYWDRAKGILDGAKDGKYAAASTLIKNASRDELAVLVEELPAYLTAHNQPTNWIMHEVGQAIPEYPSARTEYDKATAALRIIEQNANSVRRSFTDSGHRSVLADPTGYDPDQ